jgi:hypothetical protein
MDKVKPISHGTIIEEEQTKQWPKEKVVKDKQNKVLVSPVSLSFT